MGSKLIFLLGLIVGGLLIFFCINKDKRGVLLEYKNRYFNTAKVAEVATVTDIAKQEIPQKVKSMPVLIDRQEISQENKKGSDVNNTVTEANSSVDRSTQSKKINNIKEEITTLLNENPIYFKISSSTIREDSQNGLNKIFNLLKELPKGTVVTVEGHTDAIGNASSNKKLSQKRANAVMFYLKKGGLHHLIMKSKGYGEEKPLVSNPNDKKNRRVEINLERGE